MMASLAASAWVSSKASDSAEIRVAPATPMAPLKVSFCAVFGVATTFRSVKSATPFTIATVPIFAVPPSTAVVLPPPVVIAAVSGTVA